MPPRSASKTDLMRCRDGETSPFDFPTDLRVFSELLWGFNEIRMRYKCFFGKISISLQVIYVECVDS